MRKFNVIFNEYKRNYEMRNNLPKFGCKMKQDYETSMSEEDYKIYRYNLMLKQKRDRLNNLR